jgi:hypothetical protein
VDLTTGITIVGGVAAAVYIVETAGKYSYALYQKKSALSKKHSWLLHREQMALPFKKNSLSTLMC